MSITRLNLAPSGRSRCPVGLPLFLFRVAVLRCDPRQFLERGAAWRTNREMRKCLLIYLRRWLLIFLGGYALGVLFEKGFTQILRSSRML